MIQITIQTVSQMENTNEVKKISPGLMRLMRHELSDLLVT